MDVRQLIDGRRIATVVAWLVIAALAVLGTTSGEVSLVIGAGVAALWALWFGFFPPSPAQRR